jgi:GT2 family glycosyltransferase
MIKVSVVMPVYGQWDLAKRNVDSLLKYDEINLHEIIIVDDCSPESNPNNIKHPLIKIIRNKTNLGYTGTVNNGLKLATSDIVILLDSDAFLIAPIVRDLNDMLNADPTIGCLGFTSIGERGQITGSFQYEPTLAGYIIGQAAEERLKNLLRTQKSRIIPFSCCLGFRKACLQDINYFDEKTFPQVEADVDLALRIHQSKWKIEVTDHILVSHQGGNSYKINSKRVRLYHRGKWNLLRKHDLIKSPNLIRSLLTARIYFEIFILKYLRLLRNDDSQVNDKLSGRIHLLKDVKSYL